MKKDNVQKGGQPFPLKDLTDEHIWNAFVSTPCSFNENGMALARHPLIDMAREHNFQIAVTEWNWNGWWEASDDEKPLESFYAYGVGAGLGPLAGKIWRIGLMGYTARPQNVDRVLNALKTIN